MALSQGTILLTGANGGLGSAIVTDILKKLDLAAYHGVYTVRKAATATQLKKVLDAGPSSHKHDIVDLDLSSLASVRETAAEINRRVAAGELSPIRALFLNAAYQDHEELNITDDGYEITWQVNFLANQLLALMLLQSMDKEKGRILVLGSWSHDIEDKRNTIGGEPYKGRTTLFPSVEELAKGTWSTPEDGDGWWTGFRRYGASKLCAVMLMHELANRIGTDLELSNITVVGLDPGAMSSDLTRRGSSAMHFQIKRILPLAAYLAVKFSPNGSMRPLWKSAGDAVQLCFYADAPKGKALYRNGSEEHGTSKEARDVTKRKYLWEYGLTAASIKQSDTALKNWQ
ncbi:hypothetical protein EDB81DRAFT_189381 [Dactylonectria macrodidyma]|uniref:Uncharacterized protein n=1 Tax=Dactylonectria macrodidyma TaxID=307937 RepID=A0A9P9JM20_9HYPO|nr:hypothetical protein EDB81DRAFT_189381 [Dactylonectria macrodidyma]